MPEKSFDFDVCYPFSFTKALTFLPWLYSGQSEPFHSQTLLLPFSEDVAPWPVATSTSQQAFGLNPDFVPESL